MPGRLLLCDNRPFFGHRKLCSRLLRFSFSDKVFLLFSRHILRNYLGVELRELSNRYISRFRWFNFLFLLSCRNLRKLFGFKHL